MGQTAPHASEAQKFDTLLDVAHADVTASLIGCDIHGNDRVLINGHPADGILWELVGVTSTTTAAVSEHESLLLRQLGRTEAKVPGIVKLRLKPGYYTSLQIADGNCTFVPTPLIASEFYGARHIDLIALGSATHEPPSADTNDTGGVFGLIPLPGLQVVLISEDSNETLFARNEDDSDFMGPHYMYFFDSVKPGRYKLALRGFGWAKTLGDLRLTRGGQTLYHPITPEDLSP